MSKKTTWRELFNVERRCQEDDSAVVAIAPDEGTLAVEFYAGYGGTDGLPVLIWSETRVYFPVCYDGAEWMGSAPRNPTKDGQSHVGGGG